MKVIIDRFEGEYAVVEIEPGQCINIPKVLLPNSNEGDVVTIEIDKTETANRKEHIQELINNIFED